MPYCSSSGRLSGYDDLEGEVTDESSAEHTFAIEVHLFRPCAECGDEAATYDASLEGEFEHECPMVAEGAVHEGEVPEFDLSVDEPQYDDYYQTHDRRGKRITNPRYAKHLFGVTVSVTGTCQLCGEAITEEVAETGIAASYFEVNSH